MFDNDIRITLSLEDFKALVSGGIARIETRSPKGYVVKLALKDVGFPALADALQEAVVNQTAQPK